MLKHAQEERMKEVQKAVIMSSLWNGEFFSFALFSEGVVPILGVSVPGGNTPSSVKADATALNSSTALVLLLPCLSVGGIRVSRGPPCSTCSTNDHQRYPITSPLFFGRLLWVSLYVCLIVLNSWICLVLYHVVE